MKQNLSERTMIIARYIARTHNTIRKTASEFEMTKSTVHYDISNRLKKIDPALYDEVSKVLGENFSTKHIRGGEATKRKYCNDNNKNKGDEK